jgi:trk system potassium uptake protein
MNIFIIGAGFTGIELAKRLVSEGNNVTLIDNNSEKEAVVSSHVDVQFESFDGNNLSNLEEAGIAKADALVCVTDSDEINIITCSLVDSVYPEILKIARVRNYGYYANTKDTKKHHAETFVGTHRPLYGIDYMVNPDNEAAEAIVRAVDHGAATDVITFGNSDYELTRIQIEKMSKLDGIAVKNVRSLTEKKFILVYVEGQNQTTLPSGETILHAGDRLGILTKREDVCDILNLSGSKLEKIKKIILVGAGKIGNIVADCIIEKRSSSLFKSLFGGKKDYAKDLIIVDTDHELCNVASEKYAKKARIFCADITDDSFIKEENLNQADLVIAATHNHELNMVVAAYFESLGIEKTIALVSNSAIGEIAHKLSVDVTVPIRDAVVDSILSHLRGKTVTGIHTISAGNLEIIECDLPSSSKVIGKTLKEISSPGEFLVLLLKKPGSKNYEIPTGDTQLNVSDHLVLITSSGNKKIIQKFSGANI